MRSNLRSRAFTMVELLVVIAVIAILAGLIFPVFAAARGKAREITCVSNLRQIGLSIRMYAQDHDELYPYAIDPTDRYTPQIWRGFPDFQELLASMPMLHEVLQPYIKSPALFRCPADTGYDVEDFTGFPLDASPTSFQRFGTSYNYRTEIAFRGAGEMSFSNPTALNVMMDAAGKWHGGWLLPTLRYNVLYGDGHAKNVDRGKLQQNWDTPL